MNLSSAGAANAFDVMILDPALAQWLVPAGALVKARPLRYDALRVLPATLYVGRRRQTTTSVILELFPWSDHRSELAMRSADRSWLPVGPAAGQYRVAGAGALEVLARLLESLSVAPPSRVGVPGREPMDAGTLIGTAPPQRHGGSRHGGSRHGGSPAINGRDRSS
ncbi:MAG TPA: hypothetical protein VHV82_10585 [Sporichthyaceae bacterium]|nr:hypothetical protein [Sporichthyaceae bacterium]